MKDLLAALVTEHLAIGLAVFRDDGRCRYANEIAAKFLGLSLQELLSTNILQSNLAEGVDTLHLARETLTTGEQGICEFSVVYGAGAQRDVSLEFIRRSLHNEPVLIAVLSDITERRQAEKSMRFLQFSVDHSEELVVSLDCEGRLLYANDSACRHLGYSREEMLAMSVDQVLSGTSRDACRAAWIQIQQSGNVRFELEACAKNGRTFPVEVSADYFELANRSYVVGFARDITERKRASESLERSERYYRELIESISDIITVVDGRGEVLYRSPSVEGALGYKPEEFGTRNLFDHGMVHPEDSACVVTTFADIMQEAGRECLPIEVRMRHMDGSWRILETAARSIVGPGGDLLAVVNSRDITERKKVEIAVEDAERRYRVLADATTDTIFSLDQDLRVTGANRAAAAIIDKTPEELLGRSLEDLGFPPEVLTFCIEMSREVTAKGSEIKRDISVETPDGEVHFYEASLGPVRDADKQLVGFRGHARDVTDQKRAKEALALAENQLRQAQKMEAVGQLAGGVAHDFNNLLTTVIGNSDLALAGMGPDDSARELIADIKEVGLRAAALTRQLLAFSRHQVLKPETMRLNEVISGLAPLLKQAVGEGIRLDFLLALQLECTEVDAHQMEQVLLNLVLNARDAMPQGGELTLKTANVWLGQDYVSLHPEINPGRYVMLAVSDTGCGMDEETKSHIFEPFFTTKEVGKGTGLGLSTVFGIVRQSGGSLDVDTSLGNGATFRVYLPTGQPGASEATEALPSKPLERGTETILVVEDEASVRDLIGRALIRSGYSVLEAGSGPEADEVLNSRDCKPDLLLADVVLPGGQSGWDVAYALRARFPDLRLLFMSGYAREAVVSDWNLDEHVDFLGKPFTWEVLRQKVKNALDAGALSSG